MKGTIKGVLFDLDGTLLDTAQDFTEALNLVRAEENLPPLTHETVRCQVSHGGHALVRLGFGTLPPDEHEALRMRLLNRYRKQLAKHTALFEGGDEMLTDATANPKFFGSTLWTSPASDWVVCELPPSKVRMLPFKIFVPARFSIPEATRLWRWMWSWPAGRWGGRRCRAGRARASMRLGSCATG
jgi:hypothetical protein